MAWTAIATGIISALGNGITGFFSAKEKGMENIHTAIEAIEKTNSSAAAKEKAIATVIQSEARSGYWLSAVWRPLLMTVLAGIVVAYVFGFTTPNMMAEIPESSMLGSMFELLKIGVMGYMPLRTVEKIVDKVQVGKIINAIFDKKK